MQKNMTPPDWAVKFRRPGTELRRVHDALYKLYECSSVYDKEKKRARKITGKYLGSITEEGGFKESRKRIMEREMEGLKSGKPAEIPEPHVGEVKEYGLSDYILTEQKQCIDRLKQFFPQEWTRITALAYCRLRSQSPLRRVLGDFSDSFMSEKIGSRGLSPNALSGFLRELGSRRDRMTDFMRSYIDPCDNIIFDGTDQLSASRCMDYPQLTRTKKGTFDTAVNIMWIFNCAKHLPVYYRLMPGSIKDVSAFKVCIEDSGLHDGVAIIDKGFQSSSNIARLDELGIKFIMALKRSTKGLDYSVFSSRTNEAADGAFLYQKRPIWWKCFKIEGHEVYLYLDENRRNDESEDYMRRVFDPDKEQYTRLQGQGVAVRHAGRDEHLGQGRRACLSRLQDPWRCGTGHRCLQEQHRGGSLVYAGREITRSMDFHLPHSAAMVLRTWRETQESGTHQSLCPHGHGTQS